MAVQNKMELAKKITEKLINKVGNQYDYGYRQGIMDGTYNMLNIVDEVFSKSEGDIAFMLYLLNNWDGENDKG